MTLSERQIRFTGLVAQFIQAANAAGIQLTFGEVYRTPEQQRLNVQTGKSQTMNSLHLERLAVDFNIFVEGVYSQKVEDYQRLGDIWKGLDPDCIWGGDWTTIKDYDHFQYGTFQ